MLFLKEKFNYKFGASVTGLTLELNHLYINNYFETNEDNVLILTSSLFEANKIYDSIKTYNENVFLFPMDDFLSSVVLATSPELKIKRLETLEIIKKNKKSIIVTNLMGLLKFLPDIKTSDNLSFSLRKGLSIQREKLHELLDRFGYNRESLVTTTGEYAIRGFIVDIFLIQEDHPIRIEFFDDEIESIRYFDENSQMSIEEVAEINFLPYKEIETKNNSSLLDYMHNPTTFFIDYSQIKSCNLKLIEDVFNYTTENNLKYEDVMFQFENINFKKDIYIETLSSIVDSKSIISYDSKEMINFKSNWDNLISYIKLCIKNGQTVVFFLSKEKQIMQIKELLPESIIVYKEIKENSINIINKKINKGFIFDSYVIISEYDIEEIKHSTINYKNTYKIGRKLKGFDDLSQGDYIVHILHGIGVYKGVKTLTKAGIKKDYLQIDYAGNDKIYIPVEKIDTIYKYSNKDGASPKINKLGTTTWAKTKLALKKKIGDISGMLIKLYAERSNQKGIQFIDIPEEDIFASEFPYELTSDQEKAIGEINESLNSATPMDRLLCGDVGFGKTEVAFRSIFKTIMNGYQVLYLCPTTILSNQQFQGAIERFQSFAVNIGLLNRFTSKKETERIIKDLKTGKIDLVFGTHRLLSKDIIPKKLGLLVVDEEQRFGVTQKEKIKDLKKNVNVLTLSATPIPRTMKMAMSGLRDLSIIDTAPKERYPIQTYVIEENDLLIKDAIYKELSRHGQVFILYNKVETIQNQVAKINRLIPEARILYAHGQMNKSELEDVMQKFINYEADILICTTIIETGIDIPNVNTLIIYEADKFGLSQLYQIRGRVGRSNKIAYAYLLYNKQKVLTETAIKRLSAIKEFTELGSGYKVAMRDLAIRGAGDILGSEQAGFVSSVGIELYMKMIEEEIQRQNGIEVPQEDTINNSLLNVETHISDKYVQEESIKIEIHKMINEIDNHQKFIEIKSELLDRFGKIPENLEVYMYEEWFEKLALKLSIKQVIQTERNIEIELPVNVSEKISGDKLFLQAYNVNPRFQFKYIRKRIIVNLPIIKKEKHFIYSLVPLLNIIIDQVNNF